MDEPLEKLAHRLQEDPFFLACPLQMFAKSTDLGDKELAERLGCSTAALTRLRLCKAPGTGSNPFRQDIERIAAQFQVSTDVLAEIVRRGQALFGMGKLSANHTLLAARDGDSEAKGDQGGGP